MRLLQSDWLWWRAITNHIHHGKYQQIRLQGVSRGYKEGTRLCKGCKRVHEEYRDIRGMQRHIRGCREHKGHWRTSRVQGAKR